MKKIISLFLTIVLALSCSITSLAATNDQADDMELEIRQAICEQLLSDYEDIAPYDFPMMIVGTTSDGFTCFTYSYLGHPDVVVDEYFGDYKYSYNAGIEFFCYRDGIIYKIKDAYENGVINDNTIADIANMGVDITKVESPTTPTVTEPEEPTENTQPVTEADDMELEIRQAICEQLLSEYEIDDPYDFFMEIRGTTSDGFTCFLYIYGGGPDVEINEYFGDYKYSYSFGLESFCYKDGIIYKIKDAYESGVINDNTIAELAGMGLGITKVESPTTPTVTIPEEPTENTQPVTDPDDMELEIRQAICDQLLSDHEDIAPYDFPMMIVGTTSDGFTCFTYSYLGHPAVEVNEYFGDYKYSYSCGLEFFCYQDGIIYKIKDAYESGIINDNTIAELAGMGLGITKVESSTTPPVTVPEEPAENITENTQPVTETEKNTQPAASTVVNTTDPAENGATDDEAVTPTTANGNNSATPATVNGDAVKTGEPLTAVSILSALIIACAASALILKRKQNIEI